MINTSPDPQRKLLEAFVLTNIRQGGMSSAFSVVLTTGLMLTNNNRVSLDDDNLTMNFTTDPMHPNVLSVKIEKKESTSPQKRPGHLQGQYRFDFQFKLQATPDGRILPSDISLTLAANEAATIQLFDAILTRFQQKYSN